MGIGLTMFAVLVVVALQLTIIAMLVSVYSNRSVQRMSVLLVQQNERIATELSKQIQKGAEAAHLAYEEANTVNMKISDLNQRLLSREGHS